MSAYVNVHGEPIAVSARDAVLVLFPEAIAHFRGLTMNKTWCIYKSEHRSAKLLGTGANAEAAWRDAWSRMLADDLAKEAACR